MKNLPSSDGIKFSIYAIHKACEITILGLTVVRILLRIITYVPPTLSFSKLIVNASQAVHFCLYILMILMPLSGYITSSASGIKIKYFFHIPLLISKNKELASTANELHTIFAYFMVFFIILHIIAALKHIFIDKQNILKRIM